MHIKAITKYHNMPSEWLKFKKLKRLLSSIDKDVKQRDHSHAAEGNRKWYNHGGKLSISNKANKIYTYPKTLQFHSWVFTQKKSPHGSLSKNAPAALFIIVKEWQQPRCPPTEMEWKTKLGCAYSGTWLSNKVDRTTGTVAAWKDIKNRSLSERSQPQKGTYCEIPCTRHSRTDKTYR